MRSFTTAAALGLAATVSAAPFKQPTFPPFDVSSKPITVSAAGQQLLNIEKQAFGTLSDAPPPAHLSDDTFKSVSLIAFSETIEAFFFDGLVKNITNHVSGFETDEFTLETLKSIRAVEELHALNANNARDKVFHKSRIEPCKYKFPVSTFQEAIAFISETTDFVEGVLMDVIGEAAAAGDAAFTPGVASALSDEGEQNGFFHKLLGKRPQTKPFNTVSNRELAFSLVQDLVVPGSCPNAGDIDLRVLQPLTVVGGDPPAGKDEDLTFTFSLKPSRKAPSNNKVQNSIINELESFRHKYSKDFSGLTITYFNGLDLPISEPLKSLKIHGDEVTVTAAFPFNEKLLFGLSVATLTVGDNFPTVDAAVAKAIFGPANIEPKENFPADEIA